LAATSLGNSWVKSGRHLTRLSKPSVSGGTRMPTACAWLVLRCRCQASPRSCTSETCL